MINHLKIENFALIKKLELDFTSGFNVLLGETGAGKSLIIDAINFLLGGKADKNLIRYEENALKVSGIFSISEDVNKILNKYDLYSCDEVLITRSYSSLGKNDVKINGETITTSILKEIGSALLDSFNQNEQVELMKTKNHINIIDSFNSLKINDLKNEVSNLINKIKNIDLQISELGGSNENRSTRIDILRYQISEIEDLAIKENEIEEISNILLQISNSEKIINALQDLKNIISNDDSSIISHLNHTYNQLTNFANVDSAINALASRIQDVSLQLEDVSYELNDLFEKYNFNNENIDALIIRRDKIENIQHKYGKSYSDIIKFLENAKQQLELLENADEKISFLFLERNALKKTLFNVCKTLSDERRKNATELTKLLEIGLKEVGIKSGKIQIVFADYPNFDNFENFSTNGFDNVEIMFSANAGEELKSLSKTISGGEMSRFMLVLKNILADTYGTDTIIFDEIDSGISGEIAEEVSIKIEKLSKKYQIICITHLPQVASKGDNFIKVFKENVSNRTETKISVLNESEIVNQIAIMASGSLSETSVNYARELRNKKN